MINWWNTSLGEEEKEELLLAFSERRITMSSSVQEAERLFAEMLQVPYAVMTNSGSSALLISLLSLGLDRDVEVITPAITWIATPQAPALLGHNVKICDSLPDAPIIDTDHLEELVTDKTKVIMPVHLNGRYCDMQKIKEIASRVGAFVIEDACKALFSKRGDSYLGTLGDVGCFSLGMISPVSVGYGGLLVTHDKNIYERAKKIRDHGVRREPEAYEFLGFNFKISDLLASLALPQLRNMELKKKKFLTIHDYYCDNIFHPNMGILPIDKKKGSLPIYVEAVSEEREAIVDALSAKDIHVSRYHLPTFNASYLNPTGSFPNAEKLAKKCFILPSGPSQKMEDISRVVETINSIELLAKV